MNHSVFFFNLQVNETVPSRSPYSGNRASTSVQQGFIATLKDKFGFIELADHQKEVFFHFRYGLISSTLF